MWLSQVVLRLLVGSESANEICGDGVYGDDSDDDGDDDSDDAAATFGDDFYFCFSI